jgi:hypothetical protein
MKERVRHITRRSGGRSIGQMAERLRAYLVGWKEYLRPADTPRVFNQLDEWIRHRLRAIQLKRTEEVVEPELHDRGIQHVDRARGHGTGAGSAAVERSARVEAEVQGVR